ncbi:MAG: 3-dehydroquinate synthase [Candidatus Bipolaricaulota bacterium]|nr:3-dehydroquinate synthase [Candidatus Bipolaricaulota bacterium]
MKNIVLSGFMGTGKTAVGSAVAQRLGRAFVDMDVLIADRSRKSIPRIFAEDGEDVFRRLERELCRELSEKQDLVIATGGGTLIDHENRSLMTKTGIVVCLTASYDEIVRRLNGADVSTRPLLGDDPRTEIERLLCDRNEAYRSFPWQIDTTELSIKQVANRVITIAGSVTIRVRYPGGEYDIRIGDGLLNHLSDLARKVAIGHIAIVTNTVVGPLYAATVERSLCAAGFDPFTCVIPDGEVHKTLATVESLYRKFLDGGLDRAGTVVSLGGGVTGDIAGFAAATFMRGVKFAQVPTTFLAMIDASVGGKTGVDLPKGKNLVGAFKQPSLVLIDPSVLSTLPIEELRNGAAEAIKHGVISDPALFDHLKDGPVSFTPRLIGRILKVKVRIVAQDPYERGRREILNLGHTVGHAIERASRFSVPHGPAVAIGLVAAARIAVRLSRADHELVRQLESALTAWGLPIKLPDLPIDKILGAMTHDKKRKNGQTRFVLPRKIGKVEVTESVSAEMIQSVLQRMKERS